MKPGHCAHDQKPCLLLFFHRGRICTQTRPNPEFHVISLWQLEGSLRRTRESLLHSSTTRGLLSTRGSFLANGEDHQYCEDTQQLCTLSSPYVHTETGAFLEVNVHCALLVVNAKAVASKVLYCIPGIACILQSGSLFICVPAAPLLSTGCYFLLHPTSYWKAPHLLLKSSIPPPIEIAISIDILIQGNGKETNTHCRKAWSGGWDGGKRSMFVFSAVGIFLTPWFWNPNNFLWIPWILESTPLHLSSIFHQEKQC